MADIVYTLYATKIATRNASYMAFCYMKSSALTTGCNNHRGMVKGTWNIHHSTGIFWSYVFSNFGSFWLIAQQLRIMTDSPLCQLFIIWWPQAIAINYQNTAWRKKVSMENGWPFTVSYSRVLRCSPSQQLSYAFGYSNYDFVEYKRNF